MLSVTKFETTTSDSRIETTRDTSTTSNWGSAWTSSYNSSVTTGSGSSYDHQHKLTQQHNETSVNTAADGSATYAMLSSFLETNDSISTGISTTTITQTTIMPGMPGMPGMETGTTTTTTTTTTMPWNYTWSNTSTWSWSYSYSTPPTNPNAGGTTNPTDPAMMPGMTNPPAPTPTPSPTPTAGGGATTSGTGTTNAGTGGAGTSTTSGTPPDGAGAGTTGAQGTGQGDSSSQGTGDNHTLINDPVLEHLNRYGLSEGPSLSSRLAQAEQNKYDLLRKGLAAGVANLTQSQIEQILTPGPNAQSSEEIVERVMTRQHEAAKEQTYAAYFYNAFANIFVGEVAEAPNNALGVTGSVGLGLTGLDVYKDVSDLGYSLWNFKPTCGHVADVALNTIAIVPVIGVVKNLKKGADLVDSGADLAKAGSDAADVYKTIDNQLGTLPFNHKLKPDKLTDIGELSSEIQLHVDAWNDIIKREGMVGLKRRLRQWEQFGDEIGSVGRKHTKKLGPAGKDKVWSHYPDMAAGGRPKSAVGGTADTRLNSIIGGQADRPREAILKMPDDVTHLDFTLNLH